MNHITSKQNKYWPVRSRIYWLYSSALLLWKHTQLSSRVHIEKDHSSFKRITATLFFLQGICGELFKNSRGLSTYFTVLTTHHPCLLKHLHTFFFSIDWSFKFEVKKTWKAGTLVKHVHKSFSLYFLFGENVCSPDLHAPQQLLFTQFLFQILFLFASSNRILSPPADISFGFVKNKPVSFWSISFPMILNYIIVW